MPKHVTPNPPNSPPNENVLEGIRCPKCGSTARFNIWATALFTDVTDDGSTDFIDMQWDEESAITCVACKHEGIIETFTAHEEEPEGATALEVPCSSFADFIGDLK